MITWVDDHETSLLCCSYVRKAGWDARLVNESYPWIEKQIVHQPNLGSWQRAVRDGLLEVGVSPFNGFTYDHLYGTKVGGTIFDEFGRRHTAAELLASANPEKLSVLVHATVQKIVFDTKGTHCTHSFVLICNRKVISYTKDSDRNTESCQCSLFFYCTLELADILVETTKYIQRWLNH